MRSPSRTAFLVALVAPLLQACPAFVEDDYRAVDGFGGAGDSAPTGVGGDRPDDSGGGSGGSPTAAIGGVAGQVDSGAVGGTGTAGNVTGIGGGTGGSTTGGATGIGGGAGGSTTGGAAGIGGGTGGVTTGGVTGIGGGSGGTTGGSAGASGDGGDARGGTAGASGGSGGAPGGMAGTTGSGGDASGGTAGASGGSGGATGGTAGASGGTMGSGGSTGGAGGSGGTGGVLCASSPTDCEALRDALLHRYRFDGTGPTVTDSVGDADGVVLGGALLMGQGELDLAGEGQGEYVDLPNGIISELEDATIETWVIWHGGEPFQRVFDFGDAMRYTCVMGGMSAPEDEPGVCGRTYLNLMPSSGTAWTDGVRASFLNQPGVHPDDRLTLDGSTVETQVELHLALVVDDSGNQWRLYLDGALEDSAAFLDHLSDLNDLNNWLGRSQFADDQDRSFDGVYLEFRIYGAALTTSEIQTSFTEGPDATFLD